VIQLALFCSGSGSNAESIMEYFRSHPKIRVALLVYNRKEAGARARAEKFNVPTLYFSRDDFQTKTHELCNYLKNYKVEYILLAGFLLLVPELLLQHFPEKVLNIHPALLPKFGGKGMFGHLVHKAVKDSGARETGMSIHLVNEKYDEGKILFQASCPVWENDSESDIAARVLKLEHLHYPLVAEQFILNQTLI
jgi:phosphoribosylglycinamide formyltransferase-1